MTIQELIDTIGKEKQKRDFMHELTPENAAILHKMVGGTFEAVMTGKGEEKCLVPHGGLNIRVLLSADCVQRVDKDAVLYASNGHVCLLYEEVRSHEDTWLH